MGCGVLKPREKGERNGREGNGGECPESQCP